MEDENGDVGPESSGGLSELPSSGNLPRETPVENMDSENRVEESYEEGDGGEIMVEVVGSDVFVDGVSGHKEDDFGSGVAEELEGHVWENREEARTENFSEAMSVSSKGDGKESEVGFSKSRDEKNYVEEVGVSFSESVDVSGGAGSALPAKGVDVLDDQAKGVDVLDDQAWNPGIEAMAVSASAASEIVTVRTEEPTKRTPAVISEEKTVIDEAVDRDSADFVTPEPLSHPLEAVVDRKVASAEKEEVLPSTDNSATNDHLGTDSATSHGEATAAAGEDTPCEFPRNRNCESSQNDCVDGVDSVVGEAGLVNASTGGELLATGSLKDDCFKANAEPANTDGDGGIEANVDEKEVFAAKSKDQILTSDAPVPDVQDENQCSSNEFDAIKFESNHRIDDNSHANPHSIHEKSFVSEREEAIEMEFDDVIDFKDGAPNIDLPDLSSVGKDECLKTDGDLETKVVYQNHVFSSEPNQLPDGGDTAGENKDKGLNIEIQADSAETQPNMTSSGCPGDEEILEADSGMNEEQHVIATTVGDVIDDQEVVDGDGSGEKGEEINSEVSKQSLECQGNAEILAHDASTENMHLSEKDACSMAETADISVTEDHVVCNNPVVNSEVGLHNVAEGCGSCRSMEQDTSVQIMETSNHDAANFESIDVVPNEVTGIPAVSDITEVSILPEITEGAELHVSTTNIPLLDGGVIEENSVCYMTNSSGEVNKPREADDNSTLNTSEAKPMDAEEESESDVTYHDGKEIYSELGTEEPTSETDKLKFSNKHSISLRMKQSGYLAPPEIEGHFAVSDLVWGKVRSHPWWPGQIFDPADASEKAVKYYKKDSYLVAYFGDRTFAWNDASLLRTFRSHFSQIEKQSNSEAFQNAVNCALEEVSRRVELGLACSCMPKDAYGKIETQVVENAGIRDESSQRHGVDQSSRAASFEPDKLLEYIIDLAPRASSGADRLDLVITQAQLSAFCHFKGYRCPTGFPSSGELLESDADTEQLSDEMVTSHKQKHTPKDGSESRKERSLTELMGDREYSPDAEDELVAEDLGKSVSLSSARKRKALDPLADGSDKRESVHAAKISTSTSQIPKPSFKIGECIRRVASQLTGSTSLVKGNNDEMVIGGSAESFSVNEMLSQLQQVAQDPKKEHNVQGNIHTFFLGFRSSIVLNKRGRKKKVEPTVGGSGEEFEFDDVNDSYWTDRIVQNYSEEQLLHNSETGDGNLQLGPFGAEKSVKPGRKPNSRKRFSTGSYPTAAIELEENVKRRKQESSPAELILNFAERNSVPSEINLNKMFRRFGPLMESETEVDHESGRAKVIFKRGSDAEVARNSSEKFNIFGPALVNYQIGYSPLISVKILPLALPQSQDDAALML